MALSFSLSLKDAYLWVQEILKTSPKLISEGRIESETEQILMSVLRSDLGFKGSRFELFSHLGSPEGFPLTVGAKDRMIQLAHSRVKGIPLQYLLGYQWFGDHEYEVCPGVLIPRPETEILLDTIQKKVEADLLSPRLSGSGLFRALLGIEIGLGSGILSIELLSRFPHLKMVSSEVSEVAVQVTRRNLNQILGPCERLKILRPSHGDEVWELFQTETLQADFIVSNPPYLLRDEREVDSEVLLHEPAEALFPKNEDPLYFYRKIASEGREFLRPGGFVFLELPHERAKTILELFLSISGPNFWSAQLVQDLTGRDRVLVARLISQER